MLTSPLFAMPNPQHITERVFQAPQKYIQGPNAIKNSAQYLKALGKHPLLTVDDIVFEIGKSLSRCGHCQPDQLAPSWEDSHLCLGEE